MSSEPRVPRIETERLILRQLTEEDIPFLFEHFSKDEINEYSSEKNLTSMGEAKELYDRYIVPRPGLFRLGLVLKETGKLIGTIGFYGVDHTNRRAIVGADLMRTDWGKGFMTEALRGLISYGFKEMKLNRIEATADSQNLRSLRLMERCMFSFMSTSSSLGRPESRSRERRTFCLPQLLKSFQFGTSLVRRKREYALDFHEGCWTLLFQVSEDVSRLRLLEFPVGEIVDGALHDGRLKLLVQVDGAAASVSHRDVVESNVDRWRVLALLFKVALEAGLVGPIASEFSFV